MNQPTLTFEELIKARWADEDRQKTYERFTHLGEFFVIFGIGLLALAVESADKNLASSCFWIIIIGIGIYLVSSILFGILYRKMIWANLKFVNEKYFTITIPVTKESK